MDVASKEATDADADENQISADGKKRVKRKVAIVIGFVGTQYRGLQINYEVEDTCSKKSVECVVRDALIRASIISPLNARPLESKIGWSRSSRTDAGVHALRLVIAAKLLVNEDDFDGDHSPSLVAEINRELPDDIRCFGAVRVPKSFDGKNACSWREYGYLLPTHLVCRDGEDVESVGPAVLASRLETAIKHFEGCHSFHNFTRVKASDFAWKTPAKGEGKGKGEKGKGKKRKATELDTEGEAQMQEDGGGAVSDEEVPAEAQATEAKVAPNEGEVQPTVSQDISGDSQAKRVEPIWVEVCAPNPETGAWKERSPTVMKHTQSTIHMATVEPTHDGKLLRVLLRGQFFLYNQIRLMIGTAVAVCVGTISDELVQIALRLQVEMHMPLAPAVGLLLRTAGFTEMDRRTGCCAMDIQQARDSMMPGDGFVLVPESSAVAAKAFEEKVEAEVQRQWHEVGGLEAWKAKLAGVRGPSEETLAELRIMASTAEAKHAAFRLSQGEADQKRRERNLSTGSGGFAGTMPRRCAAELMVRHRILPGWRLTNIQWALAARLRRFSSETSARPACFGVWPPEIEDLLAYVAEVGVDTLAEEGRSSAPQ